jgi:pimeloyl-ACP methyl ester carboxylesterase
MINEMKANLLSIVLASMLCVWASAQSIEPKLGLELQDRTEAASNTPVRFGTMRVWENRQAQAGRIITLEVAVLPALGDDPKPDPVFVFSGGPGQNAVSTMRNWTGHWMRQQRDIVLISQRGTGRGNRLWCDLPGSDDDLQSYLEPVFREETFRACLENLGQRYDLTQYGTANAMDDVNDVRAALCYDTINLYGGSYGSRAELEYIRRHPETVRTAILNSVAPVAFINPLYHAWGAQHALDLIFDDCAADPACNRAYGDLRGRFEKILEKLDAGPVKTTVKHPRTGERVEISLNRESFGDGLRIMMYYSRSQVPYLIDRAAKGDFSPFAESAIQSQRGIRGILSLGMLLCVTCAEDLDRITEEMIVTETADTFLGDGRVRRQKAICGFWPRSILPDDAADPVTADVPVLLLSGRYDPVTPPRWGDEAASHLPSSLHVVGQGSHGQGGGCIDSIMAEVLERGTVDGVDLSCVKNLKPAPFRMPD